MTGTRDKIRSLFLATLMVTSVFAGFIAFSGTAAAANQLNYSLSSGNAQATHLTDTTGVTYDFDYNSDESGTVDVVRIDLDDADVSNVDIGDIRLNLGSGFSPALSDSDALERASNGEIVVNVTEADDGNLAGDDTSPSVSDGDTIRAEISAVTNPEDSGRNTFEIQLEDEDGDEIESGSVGVKIGDRNIDNSERVWQGQNLFATDNGGQDTVELYTVTRDSNNNRVLGTFVAEVTRDEGDNALVRTANREGDYVLVDESEDAFDSISSDGSIGSPATGYSDGDEFTVSVQDLSANFEDDPITQDEETNVEFISSRGNFEVQVSSDSLSDNDLEDIFADANNLNNPEDKDGVRFDVGGDSTVAADFDGIDTGDYSFDFEVTDTEASASDSITIEEASDADAQFVNDVTTVGQGDNAVVPIVLEEDDEAQMFVGFNDVNFNLTYDVVDEDGDGTVIVGMNTYMLGRSDLDLATALEGSAVTNRDNARDIIADSAVKAIDADTVSDVDIQQTDPVRSPPLDPTSYEMNITNIDDKTKELAVGTLQITQPNVDNTTTWTAPENVWDDLEDGEDHEPGQVYELIEEGKLTQQSSAAEEDVIVYEFETTGIFGALELSQGLLDDLGEDDDYSDALIALLDDDDTRGEIPSGTGTFGATPGGSSQLSQNWFFEDFSVRMTQENPQANRQPIEVDLRTTNNNDGLKVISDWRNESLFVAVDTAEAEGERVDSFTGLQNVDDTASDNLAIESPQRYSGNFSVSGGDQADPVSSRSNMTDGDTVTIRNDIKLTSKSIDFDTDQSGVIRASAETDQPITGTTTVAPGTELDLRIKSTGQTPFLENPRATVQEDRSFEGLVDFSDRASNTTFEATARGFDDDPTPGVIGEAPTATVTFNDQNQEDGTVTVNSATLSEGGYLVVHADDDGSPGDVLGNSEYLSAGEHFDVEVDVGTLSEEQTLHAMAHQDDGDESYNFPDADGPYTLNGTAVFDSATVSLQDESTTTEKVTTTEETTTEGTTEATTEGGETTEDESGGDGPGFTAIFALVALLGAGLLAARRHN